MLKESMARESRRDCNRAAARNRRAVGPDQYREAMAERSSELRELDAEGNRVPLGGARLKLRNVVKPNITVYLHLTGAATGISVVVAPGGAFRVLSWDAEAAQMADSLQRHGVVAFVLKY